MDIGELFRLDANILELVIRASVLYLGLILGFRVLSRREMGSLELSDMLLVVLIADGVQNGLTGEYQSVTGGLVVAATLIGWNYALEALAYRFTFVRNLLSPSQLKLIEKGRMLRRNMRKEFISEDELRSQLRAQGIEDFGEVRLACLEPDGELSVFPFKDKDKDQDRPKAQHRRPPIG